MADRVEFIITASGEGAAAVAVQRVGEAIKRAGAEAQKASQGSAAGSQAAIRAYGDMEVSIARVVSGLAAKTLALVGVAGAAGVVTAAFKKGINVVDEFNLTTIGVSATITDLSKDQSNMQMNYARAMAYSKDMYNELELAAARYFASGKEMVQAWNIMAQKGVVLRKEEIDHLGVIVDRIKLSTQGQVQGLQIAQELRAILSGQARATDQVAMLLRDRLGPEWEKVVEKVRETGSLAPLAEQFKGLALASRDIQETLESQKSTLGTLLSQIARGGLRDAYEDIVNIVKRINDYLTEHRAEIEGKIRSAWQGIRDLVGGVHGFISEIAKLAQKGIVIPITFTIGGAAKWLAGSGEGTGGLMGGELLNFGKEGTGLDSPEFKHKQNAALTEEVARYKRETFEIYTKSLGAPETVKPKGEEGAGKGAETEARRLMTIYDTLMKDIARLSEGAISEVEANLQKTIDQIYSRIKQKVVSESELEVLARKRAALQKEHIEDEFWLKVAKESGDAYVEIDAQYQKDLKKYQGISEAKEQLDYIREKKRYETSQKYQEQIEGFQKTALSAMVQASPFQSEQLVLERQLLEIEISRNRIKQDLELQTLLAARQITASQADEIRGLQAVADQYRRNALQIKEWAAAGLPGWSQGWAFERITEMEKRGYEDFKNYMGRAESWLGQTFGQSAFESLQGKQADIRQLFSDAMSSAFQDLYKISARTIFDMGAKFLSPEQARQGATAQGAGQPLIQAAQGLKQASAGFNLNAAQFGLAAGGLVLSGIGIATNSQALVVAGTVLQMAGLGIQLYQAIAGVTMNTAAIALTGAAGALNVAAGMLMGAAMVDMAVPFHLGAIVAHQGLPVAHRGLAADERLIVAQTGEGVLPRDAMRRLGPRRFESLRSGNFETETGPTMVNASPSGSFPSPGGTIIIQAWDSEDVARFLKRHGNAVFDAQRHPTRNSRSMSTFKNINGGR